MIKDREKPFEGRITLIFILCIVLMVIYATRLFSMQILEGELYQSRARNIARRTTIIPAQRGEIYDRHFNQPLVLNTDSFAVFITPGEVRSNDIPELITKVSSILNIPREQVERRLPARIHHLFQPVEIASNVSFSTIAVLAEQVNILPGVTWQSKPIRSYIDIGSLSHILGYVGSITREELTVLYNLGYQQGDMIGKDGIENQYDQLLRGREGFETRIVDVRGRNVFEESYTKVPPTMGKNLVLTIDRNIQLLAEKALGPRLGSVVVMRPSTGEVLAMVSYPWYNPNIFNQTNLGVEFQALLNDPNKPFINRAIQASYPPASAFKVVLTGGVLAENAFPPHQTIDCRGEFEFGDRVWRCHIRRPGHGRLNLQQGLAQSCNIYYWTIGRDYLGVENIVRYALDFGFGERTGIDLPGEISGFIPTPQWKERRLHERWLGGDTLNLSTGQGYTLVTPLQMSNMVAMAVNDGVIYEPHILMEVRDPMTGAIERRVQPTVLHTSNITPDVFEIVRRDMRGVINEGTARFPLNIRAVEIAGKTGTGEVGVPNRFHSWFTSFAPYQTDNPEERVVVTVIVEAANEWEWWAPYASAIIYQGIFANQTYEEAIRTLGFQSTNVIRGFRE